MSARKRTNLIILILKSSLLVKLVTFWLCDLMTLLSSKIVALFGALGEVFFVFGLFGWLYGVIIQITHPKFLTLPLSHLTPWLRVDTFTMYSFLISALGFFLWRFVVRINKKIE